VQEQGFKVPLMGPVHVLQQAVNMVRSSGAASVMLGILNPLSSKLSIGKLGDVGYLVLRPPPKGSPADKKKDLVVRPLPVHESDRSDFEFKLS
jgi:hypothetical protein